MNDRELDYWRRGFASGLQLSSELLAELGHTDLSKRMYAAAEGWWSATEERA